MAWICENIDKSIITLSNMGLQWNTTIKKLFNKFIKKKNFNKIKLNLAHGWFLNMFMFNKDSILKIESLYSSYKSIYFPFWLSVPFKFTDLHNLLLFII